LQAKVAKLGQAAVSQIVVSNAVAGSQLLTANTPPTGTVTS